MNNIKIPAFKGINNLLPDFAHRSGEDHFLRNAVNVDLTNAGTIKRRAGYDLAIAATDGHSFFAHGNDAYMVDYDTLYHVDVNLAKTSILTGLVPGRRMSYVDVNGALVCSNGQVFKQLDGQTVSEWTLPVPAQTPVLTAGTGAALPAGLYQVAVCYEDAAGRQGGTSIPQQVTVAASGKITISNLDTTRDVAVFITPPNGDVFFHMITGRAASYVVTAVPTAGYQCQTLLLAPMPAGDIVAHSMGRLLTAKGNVLSYSDPFSPALCNPAAGYIYFAAPITMVQATSDGVYVSAEMTYFLKGEITKADLDVVLPYKAIAGTSGEVPSTTDVFWMSDRGVVVGDKGGKVVNVQEPYVATEPAQVGATLFREQDGMKQFIASLFGPGQTIAAAKTYITAEVVRKGVIL